MKILLTTFGSLGDLHPYMALGLALKKRGYTVGIATSPNYREKVEAEGLVFHSVRPDFKEFGPTSEWMHKAMDGIKGTEYVVKNMVLPHLTESYVDLKRAAIGSDIIIGHPLIYSLPIVADKLDLPWISVMLQPITLFSAYDPPIFPSAPILRLFRKAGPNFHRWIYGQARKRTISWMEPVQKLRIEVGLDASPLHPLFEGQYSPLLNLALFSDLIGRKQIDWPDNSVIAGFQFYDKADANQELDPAIARFLDEGPAPIVFTLGSSAVNNPGKFYTEAAKAAHKLNRRAILLAGKDSTALNSALQDGVKAFDYAPYSLLFPRAAAIVHQGGIGTTAQALRSGKPQIIVPFAHDQPDNAYRVRKLGVGDTIPRNAFNAARATRHIKAILETGQFVRKAAEVGEIIKSEEGEKMACDAIESVLKPTPVHSN